MVVVNVRPWEEEHGKARPAMDVASKLNRSLEDRRMIFWKPQSLICDTFMTPTQRQQQDSKVNSAEYLELLQLIIFKHHT